MRPRTSNSETLPNLITARPVLMRISVLLALLIWATSPQAAEKTVHRPSPYFEVVSISRGYLENAHNDYFALGIGKKPVYIGSSEASDYVQRNFGLTRQIFSVSADGKRLLYRHAPGFAGKRSTKPGGLYLYEHGKSEKLLFDDGLLKSVSRAWPKPPPARTLPVFLTNSEAGPFRRNAPLLVTTEGESYPLGLHGAADLEVQAYAGNLQQMHELLARGTIRSQPGYWGTSALEIAMLQGDEEMALLLLQSHVPDNVSPLHLAAAYRMQQVVEALLKDGESVAARNEHGETPLHTAVSRRPEMRYWLIWGEPHRDTGLWKNSLADLPAMRALVAAGAEIDARDASDRTPFLIAVEKMTRVAIDIPFLDELLALGADINAADADGNTALHLACVKIRAEANESSWRNRSSTALVNLLLANGANVHARNKSGGTPLQDAVQANNLRTAELLVANGADDSERFVYAGMGRRIDVQTIRQRIDAAWRELYDD